MSSLAASRAESLNDAAISQGPQMPLPPKLLGRVLLADAGPGNDPLIRFYLHRMGLTTDSVTGCTQTVEHMLAAVKLSDPYRLLVLDVQGAEMSGLQVVRMLRDAGHAGPIIAVTAQDAKDDRETCLASGCDDYVTRPIDRARFEQVVTRWLQGVVPALDPG
jgi:CheY-like chemotaxis protein